MTDYIIGAVLQGGIPTTRAKSIVETGNYPNMRPPIQCSISIKDSVDEILYFESFPEGISEAYSATWTGDDTRGRSSQAIRVFYTGGAYSPIHLTLSFVAGQLSNIPNGEYNDAMHDAYLREMEQKVRWCQALCFPMPPSPRTPEEKMFVTLGDPPRVVVTLGQFMVIEGVCDSCTIEWKGPFNPKTARPMAAEVTLPIKRIGSYYKDWYDIRYQMSPTSAPQPPRSEGQNALEGRQ